MVDGRERLSYCKVLNEAFGSLVMRYSMIFLI
jgi:hypothetical protein